MVNWSYWLPDVLPHVPGCAHAIAEHELKRSAQEFFRQTFAWRKDLPLLAVLANQAEIEVETGDPSLEVIRVESVHFDNDKLTPTTRETLDKWYGDKWQAHSSGKPDNFFSDEPGLIRLYPIPLANALEGVLINASVTLTDDATGLPDRLARKFTEAIYLGARARLMLYPGVPFNNPSMAAVYGKAFQSLVDKFKTDKARSFSNARIQSKPNWC